MEKVRPIQLTEIKPEGTFSSNINFRSLTRHGFDSCVLPGLELTVPNRTGKESAVLKPSERQLFTLDKVSSTQWKVTLNVESAIVVFSFKNPRLKTGTYTTISK